MHDADGMSVQYANKRTFGKVETIITPAVITVLVNGQILNIFTLFQEGRIKYIS